MHPCGRSVHFFKITAFKRGHQHSNRGASSSARMTEIKQVLSHNPWLLKISLLRRGWQILGRILCSVAEDATVHLSVKL